LPRSSASPRAATTSTACAPTRASTGPDAGIDADTSPDADTGPSTVTVTANACPGTPDHTLAAVAGMNWQFDGGASTQTLVITIAAGENIEFTTAGQHNFASVLPTGSMSWTTGTPSAAGQTACLTFTAAGGPAPFHCETHPTVMTGTVTVTP
jgi:plastocyanin